MPDIRVIKERCVACGDCVELCPQSGDGTASPVLVIAPGGDAAVASAEGCIACFTCVEYCRSAAITIAGSQGNHHGQPDIYPTRPVSRII